MEDTKKLDIQIGPKTLERIVNRLDRLEQAGVCHGNPCGYLYGEITDKKMVVEGVITSAEISEALAENNAPDSLYNQLGAFEMIQKGKEYLGIVVYSSSLDIPESSKKLSVSCGLDEAPCVKLIVGQNLRYCHLD